MGRDADLLEFLQAQHDVWEARLISLNSGPIDERARLRVNMVRGFLQSLKRRIFQWKQLVEQDAAKPDWLELAFRQEVGDAR